MRAVNILGDDGAALLAPSLGQMTQLTSLDLGGMLRASAGSDAGSRCLRTPAVHWMLLRAVGWGVCARGCSRLVGLARGEPRGGSACRQYDRSSWGSVAGTESREHDAADVAEPQPYAELRCERLPANACCAWMMTRAVGCGGCVRATL